MIQVLGKAFRQAILPCFVMPAASRKMNLLATFQKTAFSKTNPKRTHYLHPKILCRMLASLKTAPPHAMSPPDLLSHLEIVTAFLKINRSLLLISLRPRRPDVVSIEMAFSKILPRNININLAAPVQQHLRVAIVTAFLKTARLSSRFMLANFIIARAPVAALKLQVRMTS